ncbi:MAG: glycosyltransferase family 4 protein, partial [Chloroflexota bacterium]|nr:glycosyltransferase family 4 protein [Chloroflexota bacterium]
MTRSNSALRITLIAPFGLQPKGTTSGRALPLGQALAARGHQVRLIVPPWDDPGADPAGRRWVAGGVEVVELAAPRLRVPGGGLVGWPAALLRAALRDRPDVIHLFKPKAYAGLAGLALTLRGTPWVLDTDDWEGRGGWNRVAGYSAAQRLLFQWQETTLPRWAAATTVASRTLQTQLWGLGVPPRRVHYLPNGVDAAKYDPWRTAAADPQRRAALRARYGLPPTAPVLLLWTRFVEFPLEWPLAVLRALHQQWPDLCLLVAGAGFHGEERALQAQAAALGLGNRVIVTGWLTGADLGATLGLADVALYPMRDTLLNRAKCPVKLLDLLALGIPTVAHAVGQVAEYLDASSGLLVPPGDVLGLAAGVAALLADPARRAALG